MTLDILKMADAINILENYIDKKRPPLEMRNKLDLSYKIEGQSIVIFEIRPMWNNPEKTIESPIAKTTFIKSKNYWKLFWLRADLKWHSYQPTPIVKTLPKILEIVEEDKFGCFWG
jgi:hypothetical protein